MSHAPLHPDTRNLLAREILKAREAAEAGARASLAALRVGEATPAEGMSAQERSLRNRLRASGRQLGDLLLADGKQELGYLVEEIAYQHWHRMLFARFLAENGLLREDHGDQPIDLAECEALANDEGLDVWAYAARCAQKMLPGVFRLDDPKLELRLDTPKQLELNAILKGLPSQVFTATDALGWVYQYWQAKRKEEVNLAMQGGLKVGARELSPVTQLFTEDYMVDFLLHNTLGAWWAGKIGPIDCDTEEEARARVGLAAKNGLPAIVWTYLRFTQNSESKKWSPAGGTFKDWPKKAKDITLLDPCMGSGHFLVFALPILARMRMEEEGCSAKESISGVLKDQIHGLEIDQRCCQIGAFNLAFTAWRIADFQDLQISNIACCGKAPQAELRDWLALVGPDERLSSGMKRMYRLFREAPLLGSLINAGGDNGLFEANFTELEPFLIQALKRERGDDLAHEYSLVARGLATVLRIITSRYTLVVTNVPFLGRRNQSQAMADYCLEHYPEEKLELATCFVSRSLELTSQGGAFAGVIPQTPLFLASYKKFRKKILNDATFRAIVRLGEHGFRSSAAAGGFTAMLSIEKSIPTHGHACICVTDVSAQRGEIPIMADEKKRLLPGKQMLSMSQSEAAASRDASIVFGQVSEGETLDAYADSIQGASMLDIERFTLGFWELPYVGSWNLHQSTPAGGKYFDGLQFVSISREAGGSFVRLADDLKEEGRLGGAWSGKPVWGRRGIACSWMGLLPASIYAGQVYDNSVSVIMPKNPDHLSAIWAYCSSKKYLPEVRKLNQKPQVANATLVKVPFDLTYWQKIAKEKYPNGLPSPFSSDPTQWLFKGHPHQANNPLQVAVARLLCFQWPRQTGSSFPDCPALGADGLEGHADDDGIVALSPINREEAAASRLRALLKEAYATEWQDSVTERQLLADAGHGAVTLEDWLRDSFFEEHSKLFHHRPFIWHIWDGEKDGFHVLVNYHRLAAGNGDGARLLQKLATTYLGDWIARCNQEVAAEKPGAARRLKAAQDLQADLRKILEGEAPNDIFVRWKPLHEQAIRWAPDINDGVRLNIRPFLTVRDVGKKGAGLLRSKPNIKWDKDRGKEPNRPKSDFPWFWSCDPESNTQHVTDFKGGATFTGERWAELHYTLATKRAARASWA